MKLKRIALLTAAIMMLALPVPAMAQSPTNDAYDDSSVSVLRGDDSGDAASTEAVSGDGAGGGLPFTGLDVALVVAVGAGLTTLGLGMRRLTRRPDTA